MNSSTKDEPSLTAIDATNVPSRSSSIYPEPFDQRVAGREKRALGDFFGLQNFGVNLTRLQPGAESVLRHSHTVQDEFIYVLEGRPTLITNAGRQTLSPRQCAGFPAGTGNAVQLINESSEDVVYLEMGDRLAGDEAHYPDDDLKAEMTDRGWVFNYKDGTPY